MCRQSRDGGTQRKQLFGAPFVGDDARPAALLQSRQGGSAAPCTQIGHNLMGLHQPLEPGTLRRECSGMRVCSTAILCHSRSSCCLGHPRRGAAVPCALFALRACRRQVAGEPAGVAGPPLAGSLADALRRLIRRLRSKSRTQGAEKGLRLDGVGGELGVRAADKSCQRLLVDNSPPSQHDGDLQAQRPAHGDHTPGAFV